MGAQDIGRQEAAEAAFHQLLHAQGDGFGGVLKGDVFPRGVANEGVGDAGENAHHARVDFGAARHRPAREGHDAGQVGVQSGEDFFVEIGKHHAELSAPPFERGFRGVFDGIAAAEASGGVAPRLGGELDIKVQRFGGGG